MKTDTLRPMHNSGALALSKSRPGFPRRIFSHVFDRGIYATLYALLVVISGDPGRFWSRNNADDISVTLALAFLALFVLDQLIFMAVYGVTFSKWIMGYRLRRKDGGPPGLIRAFFWNLIVEPLEVITLGIVSLILTLKREDRATLHDLVLGTRALRVKNKRRGLRLLASAALVILLFCAVTNIFAYSLYSVFIMPVKNQLKENGRNLIPLRGSFEGREYIQPVALMDLTLFDAPGVGEVDICKEEGSGVYHVMVGDKRLAVIRERYEDFTGSIAPGLRYFGMLSSVNPFKESPVDVARHVVMDGEPEFAFWNPARNLTRAYGYILWSLMVSARSNAVEAFDGPDFFITTWAYDSRRMVSIWIINNGGMNSYMVIDREADESQEAWQAYLGKVLAEFRPLPTDSKRIEEFRQCAPDEGL